jgi:hypothetical protein
MKKIAGFIFGIFADIPLQRLMMNLCIPMSIVESIEKSSPHFAKCAKPPNITRKFYLSTNLRRRITDLSNMNFSLTLSSWQRRFSANLRYRLRHSI